MNEAKDRAKAAEILRSMSPEHAYVDDDFDIYDGDAKPLIEAIAAALAAERAQAWERARAVADVMEEKAPSFGEKARAAGGGSLGYGLVTACTTNCARLFREAIDVLKEPTP